MQMFARLYKKTLDIYTYAHIYNKYHRQYINVCPGLLYIMQIYKCYKIENF